MEDIISNLGTCFGMMVEFKHFSTRLVSATDSILEEILKTLLRLTRLESSVLVVIFV